MAAGYTANYETAFAAALIFAVLFLLNLKFDYFLFGLFHDKISDSQIRNFLTDYQTGRHIQIEVSTKGISLDMGEETETVLRKDLTKAEIRDELILFEKENLFKAYIPKRACTDEQWAELLAMFALQKPS